MIKNRIILGLFFLAGSYIQFLLTPGMINRTWLVFFYSLFNLGIIFIAEEITKKFKNRSLLRLIFGSTHNLLIFLVISAIGGIILEGIAQWLDKLWIYPFFSNQFYVLVFIFGFGIYWLTIVESYLATKAIIDNIWRQGLRKRSNYFGRIVKFLLVIGLVSVSYTIFKMINSYNGNYIFDLNHKVLHAVSFDLIISGFIGIWFILEFIEYVRKETSLLSDLFFGYLNPLLAVIIGSLLLAIMMETQNIHHLWLYTNWPWPNLKIFNLYVSMLIAWPLHYVFFLSLFRALSKKESREIW